MKPQLDPQSDTWMAIEMHINERLTKLRLENDSMNNDFGRTCHLRGQIAAFKELLALPAKGAPATKPDEGVYR